MQKVASQKIKSASIVECGHYISEEQPEKRLDRCLKFLKGIGDSGD
jgi:hypothetical protein